MQSHSASIEQKKRTNILQVSDCGSPVNRLSPGLMPPLGIRFSDETVLAGDFALIRPRFPGEPSLTGLQTPFHATTSKKDRKNCVGTQLCSLSSY